MRRVAAIVREWTSPSFEPSRSGGAEMDWGTPDDGGSRHYDLESRDDLNRCVDDLEADLHLPG